MNERHSWWPGLKHIVDFIVHTDWVRSLMRKYAVWTVGLRGAWLIWSTESHSRGEQKSARERTGRIGYQGNTHKCVSIGDWNEGRGCFIGHNTHFEMRTGGVSLEGGGFYFFPHAMFFRSDQPLLLKVKGLCAPLMIIHHIITHSWQGWNDPTQIVRTVTLHTFAATMHVWGRNTGTEISRDV